VTAADLPVLADVVRNGTVESRHRGSVVVLDAAGVRRRAAGDPERPVFPRSSLKPLQAVGMLRAGLDLDRERLAIACASHSGEERHLALVRDVLAGAGLCEAGLRNTPDLPLSPAAAAVWIRAGGGPDPLHQNCSGKHAAMLATCVLRGWPQESYLAPDHPLQMATRATVADLCGEDVAAEAVDGCGAPLFAVSLTGLARAFAALVLADPGTPERRVADAMRAFPEVVGGTGRDVTLLMRLVPGLLAKDGAEGVYAAALADGSAVTLKIEDGAARARVPVLLAGLRELGMEVDEDRYPELCVPVLGGGVLVGAVLSRPF